MSNQKNLDIARQWIRDNSSEVDKTIKLLLEKEYMPFPNITSCTITRFAHQTVIKFYTYWSKTVVGHYKNDMFYINRRNNLSVKALIIFCIHESFHRAGINHPAIRWYRRNRQKVYKHIGYTIPKAIGELYEMGSRQN